MNDLTPKFKRNVISLSCPKCFTTKRIPIEDVNIKTKEGKGLYFGHIDNGLVCDHSFFFWFDRNGDTRSTRSIDIEIDIQNERNKAINWISSRISNESRKSKKGQNHKKRRKD